MARIMLEMRRARSRRHTRRAGRCRLQQAGPGKSESFQRLRFKTCRLGFNLCAGGNADRKILLSSEGWERTL